MKVDFKDLWNRAYKTFVQAFLASVSVSLAGVNLAGADMSTLKSVAVSAGVAGVAAVLSWLGNWIVATSK